MQGFFIKVRPKGAKFFNCSKTSKLKKDFEEKILENIDSLYNLALMMTQHKQDAEDLTQEAVLRACRFFSKFEAGTNFKALTQGIKRERIQQRIMD